jgi:serine/threonine protein kinase
MYYTSKYCGSVDYVSPEVLKRRPYNGKKADVWNLGMIIFALTYGTFPFTTEERVEVMRRKCPHPEVVQPENPNVSSTTNRTLSYSDQDTRAFTRYNSEVADC